MINSSLESIKPVSVREQIIPQISNLSSNQLRLIDSIIDSSMKSTFKISPRSSPRLSYLSLPVPLTANTLSSEPSLLQKLSQRAHESCLNSDSLNKNLAKIAYKNLLLVIEYMWKNSSDSKKIIEFFEEINKSDFFPFQKNINNKYSKLISEFTYLVYSKPKLAIAIIDKTDIDKTLEKIHYYFDRSIKAVHKKIKDLYLIHQEMGIEHSRIGKHIAIPIAISKILIPPVGTMLDPLISSIIEEFVNDDNPYSRSLKAGLRLLNHSDELKNAINKIKAPKDFLSNGAIIIRAALNLSKLSLLKDSHAKRAALSALLTHIRQGQSGSCFASFIAIELQLINPLGALIDFNKLLRFGKLTRTIDGQNYEFPFLMKVDIPDQATKWEISTTGKIHSNSNAEVYLWDVPGIKAIFHYIKVPSKEYIISFIQSLSFEGKFFHLTLERLIEDLVITNPCPREHLKIIFSSTLHHPLLSMWENSIAGMAEGIKGSILKSALIQSIRYLVKKAAKKNACLDLVNSLEIIPCLENEIFQRSHYLYDPTITIGNSSKGAFLLHDSSTNSTEWKKINTPDLFLAYFREVIEKVWLNFRDGQTDKIKEIILQELEEKEFTISLLKRYHRENEKLALDTANLKYLRYTPWSNSIGNDPQMVLKVYNEMDSAFKVKQITPSSAEELLKFFHNTLCSLPEEIKMKYISHGNYILPLRIKGIHVFSLLVCHSTMQPFFKIDSEKIFSPLLEKNLTSPVIRKNLVEVFCHSIVKKKHLKTIDQHLSELPKKCNPQRLRKFLVEVLEAFRHPLYRKEDLISNIDLFIFQALPKPIQNEWEKSIIHFADTNWQSDIQDIHYGIGINPGTGKIELLCVLDNGKIYKFPNQDEFFQNKVWELYYDF